MSYQQVVTHTYSVHNMDDGMGPESALEWGPFLWGGTWGFHAPIWGTHPTDKTPSSHRFSPTSLTLITLSLLLSLSLQGYGPSSALVTQGPTPTSPALPCHPDPVHPSILGLVLCASSLHCTSTRAPKHIRRDGILCLSSAAAQDWSITLRLRTMLPPLPVAQGQGFTTSWSVPGQGDK
ncbi:hypothetical protein Landi51_09518 [Colletotrichum acutatum]